MVITLIIRGTSPLFCAQSLHGRSQICMFDKLYFDYNLLLFTVSDCLGRLATVSERTSSSLQKVPLKFQWHGPMGPYLIIPRKIPVRPAPTLKAKLLRNIQRYTPITVYQTGPFQN